MKKFEKSQQTNGGTLLSDRLVAALDIGSSKVCCMIAELVSGGGIHVLGMGYRVSRGVAGGAVVDLDETEAAIRAAVDQAERVADDRVDSVIMGLATGNPRSTVAEAEIELDGGAIGQDETERVLVAAAQRVDPEGHRILHAFPVCFSVDGSTGVKDPLGMHGERLSVALHVIAVRPGPVANFESCVHKAHLDIDQIVASGYAAGLGVLVEDEKELGAAVVDLGGGTTSVGIFARQALVFSDVFPLGGQDITKDLARELLTPLDQAERLKTLYGSATTVASDNGQSIDVLQVGESSDREDSYLSMPRIELTKIIRPRLEEILLEVRERLIKSGFEKASGRRVVLTGGGSQIPGVVELAQSILQKHVRIGSPRGLVGLAESAQTPAFSVCGGLLHYAAQAPREMGAEAGAPNLASISANGKLARIGGWFRSNF